MDGSNFLKGQLALRAYVEGFSDGLDGMRAVAFALRNRHEAGWWNGSWVDVLNHYRDMYPTTSQSELVIPNPNIYSFQCLLQEIDSIFDGTQKDDVTVPKDSVLARPAAPVLYWARLNEIDNEEFLEQISRRPDIHPRSAQVGSLVFFS